MNETRKYCRTLHAQISLGTTTEVIDGTERIVSPKHAKKAEFTTRKILYKEFTTLFYIREQAAKLVRLHSLPVWAIQKSEPKKEVIYASLLVNTKHLSILAKADALGRRGQRQQDILLQIELFDKLCRENNCLGKTLFSMLQIFRARCEANGFLYLPNMADGLLLFMLKFPTGNNCFKIATGNIKCLKQPSKI